MLYRSIKGSTLMKDASPKHVGPVWSRHNKGLFIFLHKTELPCIGSVSHPMEVHCFHPRKKHRTHYHVITSVSQNNVIVSSYNMLVLHFFVKLSRFNVKPTSYFGKLSQSYVIVSPALFSRMAAMRVRTILHFTFVRGFN